MSCPLRPSEIKQFFKFGQSCGQSENTQNLTVDNQRGSENKDQRPEVITVDAKEELTGNSSPWQRKLLGKQSSN